MDTSPTPAGLRRCSYCFHEKPSADFSYEHIWPDALGGDHLPKPWQTDDVCVRCNSLSGQFVDGEFIKSWFGSQERATAGREYLDPHAPAKGIHPLHYMGPLEHAELRNDEAAELWLGPCGAHIVHIRPRQESMWDAYAGGKPSRKRDDWGTALLSLTSAEPYWITASVVAFEKHFRRAVRIVTNMDAPEGSTPPFTKIDQQDEEQARKLRIGKSVGQAAKRNEAVPSQILIRIDLGTRLLAKLALGLGRELLGDAFLDTTYAGHLRTALWERNFEARQNIPVRGSGYLAGLDAAPGLEFLCWPGGWVLTIWRMRSDLVLVVGTPSRKLMTVVISDQTDLFAGLGGRFDDGEVFVTIPALGRAISMPLPEFLAHQLGSIHHAELMTISAARHDPALLPPCR